jgi:hypothetical protein
MDSKDAFWVSKPTRQNANEAKSTKVQVHDPRQKLSKEVPLNANSGKKRCL